MTLMVGYAFTACGFCGGVVFLMIRGGADTLLAAALIPLARPMFCSKECERASATRLDERVMAVL